MTESDGKVLDRVDVRYTGSKGDSNSLKIRLESDDIKLKISNYLRGVTRIPVLDPKTGELTYKEEQVGSPKCNMQGYQAIMSVVEAYINRAVVQGNFATSDECYSYLVRTRKQLTIDLFVNLNKYGIRIEEFNGILNTIYIIVEPFMTRTIGDGERLTTRETTLQQDRVISNQGGLSLNPLNFFKK